MSLLVLLILIALPYLGYKLFTGTFDAVTGYEKVSKQKPDNITHIHHHHNTNNHLHVHSKDFQDYLDKKLKS